MLVLKLEFIYTKQEEGVVNIRGTLVPSKFIAIDEKGYCIKNHLCIGENVTKDEAN